MVGRTRAAVAKAVRGSGDWVMVTVECAAVRTWLHCGGPLTLVPSSESTPTFGQDMIGEAARLRRADHVEIAGNHSRFSVAGCGFRRSFGKGLSRARLRLPNRPLQARELLRQAPSAPMKINGRAVASAGAPILVAILCSSAASGQSNRSFCAAAREAMSHDAQLNAAAKAVFPNAGYAKRDDDCIFPLKMLRYGDADALIATGGKPGDACHGCGANVSAYVLRRAPGRPVVVARFLDFTSTGTFGDPGQIDAIQLAGHDAFAIASGGTFQGYTSSAVSFFVFEAGRLVELKPFLPLSADNGGAMTDESKAISVDGSWHVDAGRPDAITIAYKVKARGSSRSSDATWIIEGTTLSLKTGRVPPEYEAAGGN